jgi:hypothetical protein
MLVVGACVACLAGCRIPSAGAPPTPWPGSTTGGRLIIYTPAVVKKTASSSRRKQALLTQQRDVWSGTYRGSQGETLRLDLRVRLVVVDRGSHTYPARAPKQKQVRDYVGEWTAGDGEPRSFLATPWGHRLRGHLEPPPHERIQLEAEAEGWYAVYVDPYGGATKREAIPTEAEDEPARSAWVRERAEALAEDVGRLRRNGKKIPPGALGAPIELHVQRDVELKQIGERWFAVYEDLESRQPEQVEADESFDAERREEWREKLEQRLFGEVVRAGLSLRRVVLVLGERELELERFDAEPSEGSTGGAGAAPSFLPGRKLIEAPTLGFDGSPLVLSAPPKSLMLRPQQPPWKPRAPHATPELLGRLAEGTWRERFRGLEEAP